MKDINYLMSNTSVYGILLIYMPQFFGFFKYFIYLFLKRGEGREKERERNISVWLPF